MSHEFKPGDRLIYSLETPARLHGKRCTFNRMSEKCNLAWVSFDGEETETPCRVENLEPMPAEPVAETPDELKTRVEANAVDILDSQPWAQPPADVQVGDVYATANGVEFSVTNVIMLEGSTSIGNILFMFDERKHCMDYNWFLAAFRFVRRPVKVKVGQWFKQKGYDPNANCYLVKEVNGNVVHMASGLFNPVTSITRIEDMDNLVEPCDPPPLVKALLDLRDLPPYTKTDSTEYMDAVTAVLGETRRLFPKEKA